MEIISSPPNGLSEDSVLSDFGSFRRSETLWSISQRVWVENFGATGLAVGNRFIGQFGQGILRLGKGFIPLPFIDSFFQKRNNFLPHCKIKENGSSSALFIDNILSFL